MCGLPSSMKTSSHKTWQTSLLFLKPLQIKREKSKEKKVGGQSILCLPRLKKWGEHVPRVPHLVAPMTPHCPLRLSHRRTARVCDFVALLLESGKFFSEWRFMRAAFFLIFPCRSLRCSAFILVYRFACFLCSCFRPSAFHPQAFAGKFHWGPVYLREISFLVKQIADWFEYVTFVEASDLSKGMCKSESYRSCESAAQSAADSSKACSKHSACRHELSCRNGS